MDKASSKVQFIKNVGSGCLAVLVTGLVGFLMLPLNLKYLGEELYGISALAVSTLSLFSFLSMGMQPALLRFFSLAVASKNDEEFKSLSSIAQLLLGGLGLVGGIGFICTFPWFASFYKVPEAVRGDLLILFFAIGFDFWSNLYLIPYTAIIQGSNRFDIGNMQKCISRILLLVVLFLGYSFFEPSFLVLAAATFVGTLYQLTSLCFLAYKIRGNAIFFHRKLLRWNLLPSLFSFSALNLIHQVFMGLSMQLPVLILGKTLGVDMVAAFAPALQLSALGSLILVQISAPLVPIASKDIMENGGTNIGRWAIQMGEIVACFGCSIVVVFALFGGEIITVWLGESFAWTGTIVTITVMGIVFAAIQAVNYRLAIGGNTSILPTALSSVAIAVVTALGTWLGTAYGGWALFEVAVFLTLARLLRNSFFLSYSFSWQFDYNFAVYTWRVHVKPLLLGLVIIGIFYTLKCQLSVSFVNIPMLILSSLFIVSVYLCLCWKFVLQEKIKSSVKSLIKVKISNH